MGGARRRLSPTLTSRALRAWTLEAMTLRSVRLTNVPRHHAWSKSLAGASCIVRARLTRRYLRCLFETRTHAKHGMQRRQPSVERN